MGRLSGKVALITGAGSGVGRACTGIFAREGARVAGVGRTLSKVEDSLAPILAAGGDGAAILADVTSPVEAARAVEEAMSRFGRIDVLVHAAAVGHSWQDKSPDTMNAIDETGLAQWDEVIRFNLTAAYVFAKAALPSMRAGGGGSIVMVGSIGSMRGMTHSHAYCAAKAGLTNLVQSMAMSYISDGVRTNCVAPGPIDTPMAGAAREFFADPELSKAVSPMGRAATPAEIANACLFFASDESSFCNGSILVADGGLTSMIGFPRFS